jgi:hypothetical protein
VHDAQIDTLEENLLLLLLLLQLHSADRLQQST